jgi:hypothetical protein
VSLSPTIAAATAELLAAIKEEQAEVAAAQSRQVANDVTACFALIALLEGDELIAAARETRAELPAEQELTVVSVALPAAPLDPPIAHTRFLTASPEAIELVVTLLQAGPFDLRSLDEESFEAISELSAAMHPDPGAKISGSSPPSLIRWRAKRDERRANLEKDARRKAEEAAAFEAAAKARVAARPATEVLPAAPSRRVPRGASDYTDAEVVPVPSLRPLPLLSFVAASNAAVVTNFLEFFHG